MKIALADLPWPFLAETRVVAQAANGHWHDLTSVIAETGLEGAPTSKELPAMLAFLSSLNAGALRKVQHALGERKNGVPNPALL